MAGFNYKKAVSAQSTGAITVHDCPGFLITYVGPTDSSGQVAYQTDGLLLGLGSDSDDLLVSDSDINTDTPGGGTDTDGLFVFANFSTVAQSDGGSIDLGIGGLVASVNNSTNWRARRIGALAASLYTSDSLSTDATGSQAFTTDGIAVDSDNTIIVFQDLAQTDQQTTSQNLVGSDITDGDSDVIAKYLCIGPENDTDRTPLTRRALRKNLGWMIDPTDSQRSSTNTSLQNIYQPYNTRSKVTAINITTTASDSDVTTYGYQLKVFASNGLTQDRLLFNKTYTHSVVSNTDILTITNTVPGFAGEADNLLSEPGESLICTYSSTDTDMTTINFSVSGFYGDPGAF